MNDRQADGQWKISRRDILKCSGIAAASLTGAAPALLAERPKPKAKLSFGIVTDSHYADRSPGGSRHYRESLVKMAECVGLMNEKKAKFVVELGDFKDQAAKAETTIEYLRAIEKAFGKFKGPRYHAMGNHDVDNISKKQFLDNVENTKIPRDAKYYSFDAGGVHFIVLDANFRSDGKDYDSGNFNWTDANVPKAELDWLRKDLTAGTSPAVVFNHQQLDGKGGHTVKNAPEVRGVLAKSGRVLAVFQGHNHRGGHSLIEGIHYYTLKAMVEGSGEANNAYAVVEVGENLDITVTGYRKAASKRLPKAKNASRPA